MHPIEVILSPLGRAFRNRRADEARSVTSSPALATSQRFTLSSPAFGDGEEIPAKHCGWLIGDNVSPALEWSGLPDATVAALLVMEDLDSPSPTPRIHTIACFAPAEDGMGEGALAAGAPGVRFFSPRRSAGGYAGPRPMPAHGPHRYRFTLYALDAAPDPAHVDDLDGLLAGVAGHVLAAGSLIGTRTA
jgi:phosphatidylethanolamine-binding protein (PEBP) family uncharacterized protein